MPRRANTGSSSAFRQVQRQAQTLLNKVRAQIRAKEAELRRLKGEESGLAQLSGRGARASAGSSGGGGGRINWRTVLSQLPKQFKASDIRKVRGLRGKRPSEIFAAITRWIDSGLAKRKTRGQYEKK